MPKLSASDEDMRLRLLQEAVWNNGDKLTRILEHAIAYEAQLVHLARRIEQALSLQSPKHSKPKPTRREKHDRPRPKR